nr:hypothetical protein Iba_chr15dCG1000 [Ipomoea batatas]
MHGSMIAGGKVSLLKRTKRMKLHLLSIFQLEEIMQL